VDSALLFQELQYFPFRSNLDMLESFLTFVKLDFSHDGRPFGPCTYRERLWEGRLVWIQHVSKARTAVK
jgi:hypothetical protein